MLRKLHKAQIVSKGIRVLVCGVDEEGCTPPTQKKAIGLAESFHDRLTEYAITSIIHPAECLNVNPGCVGIKTARWRRQEEIPCWMMALE